jgi:hypothetical protein
LLQNDQSRQRDRLYFSRLCPEQATAAVTHERQVDLRANVDVSKTPAARAEDRLNNFRLDVALGRLSLGSADFFRIRGLCLGIAHLLAHFDFDFAHGFAPLWLVLQGIAQ